MRQARRLSTAEELKVGLGLMVQPFAAGLAAFFLFPFMEWSDRAIYARQGIVYRSGDVMDSAIAVAVGMGLAAIPVTVLGALPSLVWLLRRGPITRTQTFLAGALIGNVPLFLGFILAWLSGPGNSPPPSFASLPPPPAVLTLGRSVIFISAVGLASAAVFWLVAGRHLAQPADTPPSIIS